jgi:hypothetical protein
MKAVRGVVSLLVGAALITGAWWSSMLPASGYSLVIVPGVVLLAIGSFAATPGSWPRTTRSLNADWPRRDVRGPRDGFVP